MPQEIELKLALTDDGPERLLTHPLLSLPPERLELANTYFDTPRGELETARMALRLRRTASGWVQTLKTAGHSQGGLSRRGEWEWPVAGEALDLARLATLPPMAALPVDLLERLVPRFATDFRRHRWLLDWQGSRIELALDEGEIRAGERHAAIRELELELKDGEPGALWGLAERLAEQVALRPANASKAARGAALLAGHWPLPEGGDALALEARATAALDAWQDSGDATFRDAARQAYADLARLAADARTHELAGRLAEALTQDGTPTAGGAALALARHLHA
ncbi:CYTH domain-containing protein [Halomonas salifodinae]|uniref:CYTH domain-containing protein n=1 Tax=Halomonas salifodinae TaxID=438745 RepID=UPI00339DC66A